MDFLKAAFIGVLVAVALPMLFGGPTGMWPNMFIAWGTVAPLSDSPGLLVSLPFLAGVTLVAWIFFNWNNN